MISFYKYQGTGNDFIIIDAREQAPGVDVKALCDRHFGIGADGLMLLKKHRTLDFEMIYYNSDGNLSSMCGNGGRCIAHFAHAQNLGNQGMLSFDAVDGAHKAKVKDNYVELLMQDLKDWETRGSNVLVLNTGSPHYVEFLDSHPKDLDLIARAKAIRYSDEFSAAGINVNFVYAENGILHMRTYERGVEDETLSCGTGVTAAALARRILFQDNNEEIQVNTAGGALRVRSTAHEGGFRDIWLCGSVEKVFKGEI